jgi:hypothetical protein
MVKTANISRVSYKQSNSTFGNPHSSSRNSLLETTGEKPEGSRVAPMNRAAPETFGFSPGVSQRELRELERGFPKLELLCVLLTWLMSAVFTM